MYGMQLDQHRKKHANFAVKSAKKGIKYNFSFARRQRMAKAKHCAAPATVTNCEIIN